MQARQCSLSVSVSECLRAAHIKWVSPAHRLQLLGEGGGTMSSDRDSKGSVEELGS